MHKLRNWEKWGTYQKILTVIGVYMTVLFNFVCLYHNTVVIVFPQMVSTLALAHKRCSKKCSIKYYTHFIVEETGNKRMGNSCICFCLNLRGCIVKLLIVKGGIGRNVECLSYLGRWINREAFFWYIRTLKVWIMLFSYPRLLDVISEKQFS